MNLDELSKRSFKLEDWYTEQAKEWDFLSDNGWSFSRPSYIPFQIGIAMHRDGYRATFYVPSAQTVEAIHSKLLKYCMQFAKEQQCPQPSPTPTI